MKLATYDHEGVTRTGVVLGDRIVASGRPGTMIDLIAGFHDQPDALAALDASAGVPLDRVRLRAPVLRPGKIFAIGLNYADHIAESKMETPQRQVWFTKAQTCVNGPYDPILIASGAPGFDAAASGFAANGYGAHSPGGYSMGAGFLAEVVLTALFLFIIMGATHGKAAAGFAPIAIGDLYAGKSLQLCAAGDPVCFPGGWDRAAHSSYKSNGMANQAADFVVGRLGAAAPSATMVQAAAQVG